MWLPNKPMRGCLWGVLGGLVVATHGHAQTLTLLTAMDFKGVEFTSNPLKGNITLEPNGTITYGTNTSGTGNGIATQVQINGTIGATVRVRCTNTMTLARTGGGTVGLSGVRISIGTVLPYSAAISCKSNLNSNATTHVISANPANNIIYIGGVLSTNNSIVQNGLYKASNSGGSPATLRVIY